MNTSTIGNQKNPVTTLFVSPAARADLIDDAAQHWKRIMNSRDVVQSVRRAHERLISRMPVSAALKEGQGNEAANVAGVGIAVACQGVCQVVVEHFKVRHGVSPVVGVGPAIVGEAP